MSERRQIGRVALTAVLALVTLSTDVLLSQAPAAGNRRIVMLDGREVVEGEVIVRYRARSGRVERERAEYQADSDGSETIGRLGTRRMSSRMMTTRQMLATLRANPDVEFAEPNYVIRANAAPNDPSMGSLWGLLNTGQHVDGRDGVIGADINATAAWDLTTGSRSTIVAILDTGIDFSHPDLAANVFTAPRQFTVSIGDITVTCGAGTHGFNAFSNGCNPFDDSGHGTHVAGIIGAVGNNGIGVTGVNWTANMMALKVLDANGTGTTAEAIRAIEFAIKAKAALGADGNVRILNASWGGANYSQALADEIQAANSADMLFVAAAGSDGRDTDVTPHYPASLGYNNIISVAGVDNTGELESFSNYGATSVDLAAPGGSTLSTLPNNDYGYLSGTSMAAPFVSGGAALALSVCPMTTAALKAAILDTVEPVASLQGKSVSGGRLNVDNLLRACLGSTPLNPVPSTTALSPPSVTAGSPSFTLTVNGSSFISSSKIRVDGVARTTTFVSSSSLTTTITASEVAAVGSHSISVINPPPAGGTSGNLTLTITAPGPSVRVNGSPGAVTVAGGMSFSVTVSGGPGTAGDWLNLVPAGSAPQTWGTYIYVGGTETRPATGVTSATVTFIAPSAGGSFEVRFYANESWSLLATSGTINVTPSSGGPNQVPGARPVVGDYDGDGKADRALFKPSSGVWSVPLSSSSPKALFTRAWGADGDVPALGDYDGDGKTDIAIYRRSSGLWAVLLSSTGFSSYVTYTWGVNTDTPVPADYDGDGITDLGIYRSSTGLWAVRLSSTNYASYVTYTWGAPSDTPAPADYDGDGKAEIAIFRPSTGDWVMLRSTTNWSTYAVYHWGANGDVAVPSDYDRDGKVDLAIYRPNSGLWAVLTSSSNYSTYMTQSLGVSTDLPRPADYDGDGDADFAVYRPVTNAWLFQP